jgi:hypothetical protein
MPEFCELRYIATLLLKSIVSHSVTELQFITGSNNIIQQLPAHVINVYTKGKQLFIELLIIKPINNLLYCNTFDVTW